MNMPISPSPVSSVTLGSVDDMRQRIRSKSKLKGRQPDDVAVQEVRDLLGSGPHARDLLIEHLHRLQDHYRCLHDRHLVALAKEMRIGMAEVFEVATFYHHFEVLKGDAEPAALTVRVCDGLSCEMAGAQDLLARLPVILGRDDVRVISAPCIGRCEQAPAAAGMGDWCWEHRVASKTTAAGFDSLVSRQPVYGAALTNRRGVGRLRSQTNATSTSARGGAGRCVSARTLPLSMRVDLLPSPRG